MEQNIDGYCTIISDKQQAVEAQSVEYTSVPL